MNKILVTVFDTEEAAFTGLTALKQLHLSGDITLYETAVIAKDRSGRASLVQVRDEPPRGTVAGLLLGSLLGALSGPFGMILGATAGTVAGATHDIVQDGIDNGFVEQVRQAMAPGKVVVLADVEESWVTPVNVAIGECGGVVFRSLKREVVEDLLARESAELESELKHLKDSLSSAAGDAKAAAQARIAVLERSLQETRVQASARANQITAEWEVRRTTMEKQLEAAQERWQTRIRDQIQEARLEYDTRMAKLRMAQRLAVEALKP